MPSSEFFHMHLQALARRGPEQRKDGMVLNFKANSTLEKTKTRRNDESTCVTRRVQTCLGRPSFLWRFTFPMFPKAWRRVFLRRWSSRRFFVIVDACMDGAMDSPWIFVVTSFCFEGPGRVGGSPRTCSKNCAGAWEVSTILVANDNPVAPPQTCAGAWNLETSLCSRVSNCSGPLHWAACRNILRREVQLTRNCRSWKRC